MSRRLRHRVTVGSVLVAALLGASGAARAQAPPGTDIHVAELAVRDGRIDVGRPENVTRRPGYDNQPGFSPDGGSIYFTSVREDGQADIYRYDLASGHTAQVTRTPESEYSATVLPGGDGISVVRVEADSTQRLWRFSLDGTDPRLVLTEIAPVGYHAWGDATTLALFVLGSPATLRIADTRTGAADVLAERIGRSLHRVPGRRAISFVHIEEDEAWIKILDLATREAQRVIRTVAPGENDYAWTPDGSIVMGSGSKLFRFDPAGDQDWREIADLAAFGIDGISRLAVSPDGDRIAIVAAEPE